MKTHRLGDSLRNRSLILDMFKKTFVNYVHDEFPL